MKTKTWWESWRISFFMFVVFLLGIIIIFASYILNLKGLADWQLVHDIGIGFIVAGILGVTVDQVLRRQLAEDAFRASIGYILPEELKGEMEWIYNNHVLCIEHTQTCELHPIDDETCTMHVKMLRKLRNISGSNESLKSGVGIDEWFHKTGSSKILSFGYTKLGTKSDSFEVHKTECTITVKEQTVSLAPKEEITVWLEVEEIKRTNDANDWVFACPTLNPTVTVKAFEGISIRTTFGYRSAADELGIGTYRLEGTLLPGQRIETRWWKKVDSEKWLSDNTNATEPPPIIRSLEI